MRGANVAVETTRWSVFFAGLTAPEGRAFAYAGDDLLQERELAPPPAVLTELREAARRLTRVTDFAYDRNLVGPEPGTPRERR